MKKWTLLFLSCPLFAQQNLQLTLDEAHKMALQNHPQIAAAKYTAAAAEQVTKETSSAWQPALSANLTGVGADSGSRISAGGLNNPVVYNRIGSGVTLSQLITDFGRTSNLVESSKLRAEAQTETVDTNRQQVLLGVDRAFFGVLRAKALLQVAQQTVQARQLIVDQVSTLAQNRMKSQLDVSFAKVNLSDAQLLLSSAQNQYKAGLADLATALGVPGEQNIDVVDTGEPKPITDALNDLVREAIDQRPELRSLRLEESAAQRFAKAERALMFPSVSTFATTGLAPVGQEAITSRYGAIGVNLSLPLLNGGLFSARRKEADLRASAVDQNVKDLENRVIRDTRVAYLNAENAYDRLGLTKELLDQAGLALELAQSRYDLGLSSIVELSQAQLNMTSAQISATAARYDFQLSRKVLDYQTGNLR